ncbi:hypothetical protein C4577_01815 [Candidatus Parcubacteria bacterium]|nr:MAG: hypothetical protein C4577_01815 [Candidatus Parcubacteria bacterium]
MAVSYHESQATFYQTPNKEVNEKFEEYKKLVGTPTYSTVTGKSGRISSINIIKNNVFFRVEVSE